MGRVYLGRSPGGRQVAIKVIRPELAEDADFRARFAREVSAARKVSGIFTASVVDADLKGPVPWLATSYIAGPSLADAVATRGPMPESMVLRLAAGLAEGLSAIHAAGVVHRDLKPSNVLLADDGPRLIDFGISRSMETSALTQTGTVVGSPGFMSPEQTQGREVGPPSDIFSLGAVLTFAATGEGPFGQGSTVALLYRVVTSQPNTAGLPGGVRALAEHCLAKDPRQRPTANGLLAEITPAEQRGRAFGYMQATNMAGMVIGPAIGGFIALLNLGVVFTIAAALSGVTVLALVTLPNVRAAGTIEVPARAMQIARRLLPLLLLGAGTSYMIGAFDTIWSLYLTYRGASTFAVGLSFVAFAVPAMLLSGYAGTLGDRFGPRRIIVIALFCTAFFASLYPFIASVPWLIGLGLVEGAVTISGGPSLIAEVSRTAAPGQQARTQGVYQTVQTLIQIVGTLPRRGVGFKSRQWALPGARRVFHFFGRAGGVRPRTDRLQPGK